MSESTRTPRVSRSLTVDLAAYHFAAGDEPVEAMRFYVRRWEEVRTHPAHIRSLTRDREMNSVANGTLFHAERDLIAAVAACVGLVRHRDGSAIWGLADSGDIHPCCVVLDGRRFVVPGDEGGYEYGATLIVDDAATGERIAVGHGQHSELCVIHAGA